MIGQTVHHYEIRERLGRGGMGVVYKAWDTRLDRWVALKFLPRHTDQDALARERFVREAKALSGLEHPNICTIHEIGETDDGQLFICMAFIDGDNLRQVVQGGPLGRSRAIEVAQQLCRALAAAHDTGTVHRDLKPSNIMVTRKGDVAIVDFGLAQLAGELSLTRTGATLGTTAYMSPEQIRGEELDYRTDLWSLGVIIYQLLTGEYPFEGDYEQALRRAILEDDPEPPSRFVPELPPHVDTLAARLLAKDRNRRFRSGAEIERTLLSLERSEDRDLPTQWPLPKPAGRSRRFAGRRRLVNTIAAVLALVALTVVGFLALWPSVPEAGAVHSLAVLPFENFTGDEAKAFISEGIANGLITSLSELSGLTVLSRSEAWKYRGKGWGARQLGDRLGVEMLLEGDLSGKTDGLAVTAKLLDAVSGTVLWKEEVRGTTNELPELTRHIASRLTDVLSIRLTDQERQRLERDPTRSFRAYELYLRGQQYLSDRYQVEDLEAAAELFRQALRIDPQFALAHAALSEASWEHYMRVRDPPLLERARSEAEEALAIDPQLPAAQVALARVQRSSGRYTESIAALEDALRDHPNPDAAHRELALSYERLGDLGSAEAALRTATLLGANNWWNWNVLGAFLWRQGEFHAARDAFLEAERLAPDGAYTPKRNLGGMEISLGNWDEAIDVLESLPSDELSAPAASNLGTAYYFSNRPDQLDKASEYYKLAAELNPRDHEIRRNLADVELARGHAEAARAQYLEALHLVEQVLASEPRNTALRLKRCFYAARAGACEEALAEVEELAGTAPRTGPKLQHFAYVYALCGKPEAALEALEEAIESGVSPELIRKEPEFESLRDDPEFLALVGGAPD